MQRGGQPDHRTLQYIEGAEALIESAGDISRRTAQTYVLSVVMGPASIEITFNRYGKPMPGGETEAGRLLADYFASA